MVSFATGFKASLVSNLGPADIILPISSADRDKLCSLIGDDHTYLVLHNGVCAEVVRAECINDQVQIVRSSNPITLAKCDCVYFEVTEQLLNDFASGDVPVCNIVAGDGIQVDDDGCEYTVSAVECDENPVTWFSNGVEYTFENGCITTENVPGCALTEGIYENATVTVNANGDICSVAQGSNIVYTQSTCCNCDCNCNNEQP